MVILLFGACHVHVDSMKNTKPKKVYDNVPYLSLKQGSCQLLAKVSGTTMYYEHLILVTLG